MSPQSAHLYVVSGIFITERARNPALWAGLPGLNLNPQMLRAGQPPRDTGIFWVRLRAPDIPSGFIARCFGAFVVLKVPNPITIVFDTVYHTFCRTAIVELQQRFLFCSIKL